MFEPCHDPPVKRPYKNDFKPCLVVRCYRQKQTVVSQKSLSEIVRTYVLVQSLVLW